MTDADTAAEEQDEKDRLASRRLSVALRMHDAHVAENAAVNAARIAKGINPLFWDARELASCARDRADELLAALERPAWRSSEPRSPSPPGPT